MYAWLSRVLNVRCGSPACVGNWLFTLLIAWEALSNQTTCLHGTHSNRAKVPHTCLHVHMSLSVCACVCATEKKMSVRILHSCHGNLWSTHSFLCAGVPHMLTWNTVRYDYDVVYYGTSNNIVVLEHVLHCVWRVQTSCSTCIQQWRTFHKNHSIELHTGCISKLKLQYIQDCIQC